MSLVLALERTPPDELFLLLPYPAEVGIPDAHLTDPVPGDERGSQGERSEPYPPAGGVDGRDRTGHTDPDDPATPSAN